MRTPKIIGRAYKPFDWFGWFMALFGIVLLCKFGGIGWIFGTDKEWWLFAAVFFCFWEYANRVAFGRIYKFVYYDTVLHNTYKVIADGNQFYVSALNADDLALYMETTYPELDYSIVDEFFVESFVKTEQFV